jgi:hypothetical protein
LGGRGTYLGHELAVGLRSGSAGRRRGWGRNLLLLLLLLWFALIDAAAASGGGRGGRGLLLHRPVIGGGGGGGVVAIMRRRLRLWFFGLALVVAAGCLRRLCSTLGRTALLSPLRSGIALRRWRRG